MASLAELRQLRLLHLNTPRYADEADWGRLAAALAALLADGQQVLEGGGGESRLRLGWEDHMTPMDSPDAYLAHVAQVKQLQAALGAASAVGQAALFTY